MKLNHCSYIGLLKVEHILSINGKIVYNCSDVTILDDYLSAVSFCCIKFIINRIALLKQGYNALGTVHLGVFTQATLCTTTMVYGVLVHHQGTNMHHQGAICTMVHKGDYIF